MQWSCRYRPCFDKPQVRNLHFLINNGRSITIITVISITQVINFILILTIAYSHFDHLVHRLILPWITICMGFCCVFVQQWSMGKRRNVAKSRKCCQSVVAWFHTWWSLCMYCWQIMLDMSKWKCRDSVIALSNSHGCHQIKSDRIKENSSSNSTLLPILSFN